MMIEQPEGVTSKCKFFILFPGMLMILISLLAAYQKTQQMAPLWVQLLPASLHQLSEIYEKETGFGMRTSKRDSQLVKLQLELYYP